MTEGTAAGLLPLPFVRADHFEVVAAYVEHFYRAGAEPPAAVRAPLRYADLYDLSPWEARYCVRHLLRLPQLLGRRGVPYDLAVEAAWLRHGAWVDAMGAAPADGIAAAPPPCFTTEEQQQLAQRLLALVEVATRLGVAPLQSLCAALVANLLVGQPEAQVRAVLAPPGGRPLAPFTEEKRAALLRQHPWLDASAA
ncbi:hypothetical protein STCU_08916 [Strigomonas culicis]|uniref:Uncharacterized protein n=1 Tax=Strigomonas culicis TaxID=28005 RepID=S9TQM1_9TRYP|nr:hypothetical protein STCU_08916 [Strigomonas culicis]|eukprot:EPY20612.1 hypothetical protein STCU_08916 [Strigomonas culicis]